MTTFDRDFVRLRLALGTYDVSLLTAGLEWPPPRLLFLGTFAAGGAGLRAGTEQDPIESLLWRTTCSSFDDDLIASAPNVARGAEYRYVGTRRTLDEVLAIMRAEEAA